MLKKIFPFLLIFLSVSLLYYPVLSTYFSQDDFFHFKVSQTNGSITGFLHLLEFHKYSDRGIAFYRPISREILFNLDYYLFGLNSFFLRAFSFFIHFINIILVYYLINKLFNRKYFSLLVAFFFGISSANVASLYYLAGGIQTLLVTTFLLLTLINYLRYLKEFSKLNFIASFFTFLLALGSHEQAVIIPFLLIALLLIFCPTKLLKREILKTWPFFLSAFCLFLVEYFLIGFSANEKQYQLSLNIKTVINSLGWYSSWALGLPEMLIDFTLSGLKLNPDLIKYWGSYFKIILPAFFIVLFYLTSLIIFLLLKKRNIFLNKTFLFLIYWFMLGLIPVIFLPLHKSTHYLAPVLAPFWGALVFLVLSAYSITSKRYSKASSLAFGILIGLLILLSTLSSDLGKSTNWAATRGKFAEKLTREIKNTYPILPKGAIIYFKNDPNYPFLTKEWGGSSKQASVILNGSDALQLLYKDPTLKVFYEDLGKPLNTSETNLYTSVLRIN